MRAISRCLVRRSQPRRNWRRCISRRRRCSMGRSAERRKKIQTTSRTLNATGSEPAWRRGPRAAALEPLAEKRDGVDLERSEQVPVDAARARVRSEEHTSELQSQSNLVCRLLLEKKKKLTIRRHNRGSSTRSAER